MQDTDCLGRFLMSEFYWPRPSTPRQKQIIAGSEGHDTSHAYQQQQALSETVLVDDERVEHVKVYDCASKPDPAVSAPDTPVSYGDIGDRCRVIVEHYPVHRKRSQRIGKVITDYARDLTDRGGLGGEIIPGDLLCELWGNREYLARSCIDQV